MNPFRPGLGSLIVLLVLGAGSVALAQSIASGRDPQSRTKAAGRTREPARRPGPAEHSASEAMRGFRKPEGLETAVFAAEPMVLNPVAFALDERGTVYVAETFRHSDGVTDTRGHLNWLDDDLACRTVADRVAMYRKYLGVRFLSMSRQEERVRRLVDRDGDGKADTASIFVDGYRDPAAGIGAGLLARGQTVWYACIPWLWRYDGRDGQGRPLHQEILHQGYGVHVGFLGHDLHGLVMGPDGRLYFSIGDRGFHVQTREGQTLEAIESGSVLRCEPDGSRLEIFASGLRNPQELAFNELGDLFTCDNNSDSGDKARWVHVVEAGDSGWRIGFQFMEGDYSRGPWNEEKLWRPAFPGQAAYLIPPLANISDGPSGLTYNPGVTLLPDRYKNHFFLVDFRGSSGQSGIRSFAAEPAGASYRLTDSSPFLWQVLATDVDFGPDGAVYFSDWVEGWDKPGQGRIYRVFDPLRKNDALVREVRERLARGFEASSIEELTQQLGHADYRIRRESQFQLVGRGAAGRQAMEQVANSQSSRLARLHAIWGLGQLGRRSAEWKADAGRALEPLLRDGDGEIRAQAARILGELRIASAVDGLIALLTDESPRARFAAAMALGKLASPRSAVALIELLRKEGDDPFIRHAAVMGLVGSPATAWKQAARDPSPSVRTGVLLAMRRLRDPEIALFLADSQPAIVLETARAIHDTPIEPAQSKLAELPLDGQSPAPLARRVMSANARLGDQKAADRLAGWAVAAELPLALRLFALARLGEWARPSGRDPVLGLWRPVAARSPAAAAQALASQLPVLCSDPAGRLRNAAIRVASKLEIRDAARQFAQIALDRVQPDETRAQALKALGLLNNPQIPAIARQALELKGAAARVQALALLARQQPHQVANLLEKTYLEGGIAEKQGVLTILPTLNDPAAKALLRGQIELYLAGKTPPELDLEMIEAGQALADEALRTRIENHQKSSRLNDPLGEYRQSLAGGDPRRGRSVFFSSAESACQRCHKIREGAEIKGGEVGPDLSDVGARLTREKILEAVVAPNLTIAQGFESVVLVTVQGKVVTGVLRGEDSTTIHLVTAEGKSLKIAKSEVEERKRGPSAMPADVVQKLSKRELRDLIAYLATLRRSISDEARPLAP